MKSFKGVKCYQIDESDVYIDGDDYLVTGAWTNGIRIEKRERRINKRKLLIAKEDQNETKEEFDLSKLLRKFDE